VALQRHPNGSLRSPQYARHLDPHRATSCEALSRRGRLPRCRPAPINGTVPGTACDDKSATLGSTRSHMLPGRLREFLAETVAWEAPLRHLKIMDSSLMSHVPSFKIPYKYSNVNRTMGIRTSGYEVLRGGPWTPGPDASGRCEPTEISGALNTALKWWPLQTVRLSPSLNCLCFKVHSQSGRRSISLESWIRLKGGTFGSKLLTKARPVVLGANHLLARPGGRQRTCGT
jgi:hypothetical protein